MVVCDALGHSLYPLFSLQSRRRGTMKYGTSEASCSRSWLTKEASTTMLPTTWIAKQLGTGANLSTDHPWATLPPTPFVCATVDALYTIARRFPFFPSPFPFFPSINRSDTLLFRNYAIKERPSSRQSEREREEGERWRRRQRKAVITIGRKSVDVAFPICSRQRTRVDDWTEQSQTWQFWATTKTRAPQQENFFPIFRLDIVEALIGSW